MQKNPLIIFGSSRSDGNTRQAIHSVIKERTIPIIDLIHLDIGYYDYAKKSQKDDFMALAEKMIDHDPLILATPVYWYTMSAIMKNFIDRWSDLLTLRKDLGRKLAGKEMFIITSYASEFPSHFESPFSDTCAYMAMKYGGCFYYYSGDDREQINQNTANAQIFEKRLFHTQQTK